MRPLRLLLSLATSLITITLLLYVVFGSQVDESRSSTAPAKDKGTFKSFFSFTSPGSLFPPSAIISLTDDNSTFFLARPAAFGPSLPSESVSGQLWIGSGFGEDSMGKGGELGCSDIPGWDGSEDSPDAASGAGHKETNDAGKSRNPLTKQPHGAVDVAERSLADSDGTDDHLQPRLPLLPKYRVGKTPEHADIESLQQTAEISGKVVLLKRGGCGFLEKVLWAQKRGGVALIVGDDQRGGALVRMYARGDTSNVTIPALFTSHTTAHLLSSLLPAGEFLNGLLSDDTTKPQLLRSARAGTNRGRKEDVLPLKPKQTQRASSSEAGWFSTILDGLGIKFSNGVSSNDATRRPPNSGKLNWSNGEDASQPIPMTRTAQVVATQTSQDFIIGEQDWRDPALLASIPPPKTTPEGTQPTELSQVKFEEKEPLLHGDLKESSTSSVNKQPEDSKPAGPHEGLWVTLTPTNMSTSPFFDTLLVLVVSPLVTLTVVYALLLLRSRIRRRRWRAPKSLVDRLPIRTYHTISDSSPSATPSASSPSTPLLQHAPPSTSPQSRPQSSAEREAPAPSSSALPVHRTPEEEVHESGLAAWRRKYGGRQRECVVCLEEYVDGISQVMSLPCGHEFHADCITPWLVTRRRTCPICKGDVVRSLSQSYHDHAVSRLESRDSLSDELADDVQAQAFLSRNDSPSASRPLPISPSSNDADIEANWDEDGDERSRRAPRERSGELSNSFREAGSSAVTAIWRGFEAVGRATGLQRRSSREELDRDR
ncbi:uncharacterized protein CC84DRAFT_1193833 [Paraphaeosphaeria sporulosa]|uniref:RING-type E3 ubiquitin transferase n=1 Tax=Paraphaeosphaeria sporulosa TaxID=1460663 RepID=A0A177CTW1_9PLEO|nr:uncharacterized protein CC84DRAFT_1193833 [Paraphaeosphaeria sporulosa]OAG10352.1 hypothetical protein CC84DRAFT_1193833 [Paraphaeosphaeria sporulosa]